MWSMKLPGFCSGYRAHITSGTVGNCGWHVSINNVYTKAVSMIESGIVIIIKVAY